ncbi:MAG: cytochrome c oxidase assembly protein [Rhizobiaceae bacterium]|nr:cytochrome c oxidase assembly protein [Rhizobiaceae bacterium]
MNTTTATNKPKQSHRNLVIACSAIVIGMAGLSYAAVPLYRIFCQITGYGGTTQRADNADDIEIIDRQITVRFDGNIANGLNWEFKPKVRQVTLKLGEQTQFSYVAENLSDKPLTGTATFNVTPQYAGAYFNKIECFCFTETTLQPGEKIDMPVVFFIDPELDREEIMKNLKTITLSYTFFPKEMEAAPVASVIEKNEDKKLN